MYYALGNEVNLTLLEVSERYIKGVFEVTAKMYTEQGTYDSLFITEGEFHIDRKQ